MPSSKGVSSNAPPTVIILTIYRFEGTLDTYAPHNPKTALQLRAGCCPEIHTRGFQAIWPAQYAKIHVNATQKHAHAVKTAHAALPSWGAVVATNARTGARAVLIASAVTGAVERLNAAIVCSDVILPWCFSHP